MACWGCSYGKCSSCTIIKNNYNWIILIVLHVWYLDKIVLEFECDNPDINCLTAIGHKSGSPIHRDGPLVSCIYLAFSTNNIYCYWLMRGRLLCANQKRAFKSAWCMLFPLLSTAGKQIYNFLKNVNITDVISSLQVSSFFILCDKVAEMIL